MKYHSFKNNYHYKYKYKYLHSKNQTIKNKLQKHKDNKNNFHQKGGDSSLASIINETANSRVIGPKDISYPVEYIGYNVVIPPENKPFTLEQLIHDSLEEGHYLNADQTIDLLKLNDQLMNDSFRMNLAVNHSSVFNSFKSIIADEKNTFNEQLTQVQPITELSAFTEKLLEIFPKLQVNEKEISCIHDFAGKNSWTILPNYWAFLPFYDQILNEEGIVDKTEGIVDKTEGIVDKTEGIVDKTELNNIKVLSQQNISKNMMDVLMKFVSLPSVFHNTLQLGGSFKTFGNTMNSYISQIPTAPFIDINITGPDKGNKTVTIQNKLYFSLLNVENEFGLAVISTCIYADFQSNQVFMLWKIDRWRNAIIKQYYQFVVNLSNKGTSLSEDLLDLMQTYMYNNKISDGYPKTHKELLNYFMHYFSKEDIMRINEIVKDQLKQNKSDTDIANLIVLQKGKIKKEMPEERDDQVKEQMDQPEDQIDKDQNKDQDTDQAKDQPEDQPENQDEDQAKDQPEDQPENQSEDQPEDQNKDQPEDQDKDQIDKDEEQLDKDEEQMKEANEYAINAIEQYNQDEQKLRDDQPLPSDTANLTSTLATLGSVTALGAIGTGLYYAAPLLMLGGGNKTRTYSQGKRKRKGHKTRRVR